MKSSGISRCVDELGRIVIPKEMRNKLGIGPETPLEIHLEGDSIVMHKESDACIFCASDTDVTEFRGKMICAACREQLKA